jgi:hypothetical protein
MRERPSEGRVGVFWHTPGRVRADAQRWPAEGHAHKRHGCEKQVFAGQVSFLRLKNVDSLSCLKLRKRAIVE